MLMTEMSVSAPETACVLQNSRPHRHFTRLSTRNLACRTGAGMVHRQGREVHQACIALRVLRPLLRVQPGTHAQLLHMM